MITHDSRALLVSELPREKRTAVVPSLTPRQVRSCRVCRLRKVKVRPEPIVGLSFVLAPWANPIPINYNENEI